MSEKLGGTGNSTFGLDAGSETQTREAVWLECQVGAIVNNECCRNRGIILPRFGRVDEKLGRKE